MSKLVVDTNIFLRWLLNDIPKQADEVEKLFQEAKKAKKKLIVPQIIIFELAFALDKYYHFPKREVIDKLKSLLATGYIKIQDREIFKEAISFFGRKNVSLVDCFIINFAKQHKANLFSFDRNLNRLAKV